MNLFKFFIRFLFCFGFFTVIFAQGAAAAGLRADIISKTGKEFTGKISCKDGYLEWRRDIYYYTDPSGKIEPFFIRPPVKGKISLSAVKKIERITQKEAPVKKVIVDQDNREARLKLSFKITRWNGKVLYISDFITLYSFYIDVKSKQQTKRFYISQLKSITVRKKKPASKRKASAPAPVKKQETSTSTMKKAAAGKVSLSPEQKKTPAAAEQALPAANKKQDRGAVNYILLIMSGLMFMVSIVMIIFLIRQNKKRSGKKKNKKR